LWGITLLPLSVSVNAQTGDSDSTAGSLRQDPVGPQSQARTIAFTVPVVRGEQVFDDLLVEIGAGENVSANAATLRAVLSRVLNESGLAVLDTAIAERDSIQLSELAQTGVVIEFNAQLLQLTITSVPPELLPAQLIRPQFQNRSRRQVDLIAPAQFSSYINLTGNYVYSTAEAGQSPDAFFDGATRFKDVVLEYDGAITDQFSGTFEILRRATRLVYDDPSSYRRYAAGDVLVNNISVLRTARIGGIGIEKNRRLFDPSFTATRLGGQQIFLDNRSTVDVLVDGELFDSLQLEAGTYDLSTLPVRQGSNNIELRIIDSFGREQIVDYNFFYEQLSLPPGGEEYSFYVGLLSDQFTFTPQYSGPLAATGYYRKAFSPDLVLGGAVQVTPEIQTAAATVSLVPQLVPGVFDLETGLSTNEHGAGLALRGGYRLFLGAGQDLRQLSFNIDYESSNFTTIDTLVPINFNLLSVTGSYTQSFGPKVVATVGGTYLSSSANEQDNYNLFANANIRISQKLRLTAGVDYGRIFGGRTEFGFRVGLSYAFGGRTRANIDYRSQINSFRANISRVADQSIGAIGYDVSFLNFDGETQGDLQVNYSANRFRTRADFSTGGGTFGELFDEQRARLQIGTSLAFADGAFGVGRPISNSFFLAKPHEQLKEKGVVTARTLSRRQYYARSGLLGAALQGNISPYIEQSLQYDAANPADGFDVGDGVIRIEAPYRSGYKLVVGSENYVSLIGVLEDPAGPVSLATGTMRALDENDDFEPSPFFTNSSGRFGVFGLAPGRSYEVTLSGSGRQFVIKVREDTSAILRIGTITIEAEEE
jgi:outer membrane usher protein